MRERSEFLTDREMFVLNHHPAMSYRAIGLELGISPERVRQIKAHAERRIREEERRELAEQRAQLPVTLTIRRADLTVIVRGLDSYRRDLLLVRANMRRKNPVDIDPELHLTEKLIQEFREILKQ